MEKETILKEMTGVFRNILDNDHLIIGYDTTAKDVEGWDSLTQIQLTVAIEKHFKLKFKSYEIYEWKNVGDICDAVLMHH